MERSGTRSDGRGTPSRTRLPYRHFVRLRYQSCVENLELLKAIEFDDETRSEIRATIELLERWLKVRRRALDEGRPIPLANWYSRPLSEHYDFKGPRELSDREREAVSLYAETPYKPQWRGLYSSCPPEEILLEIERKLGPAESDLWRPKKRPEDCTDAVCDGAERDGDLTQAASSVSRGVDGVKAAVGKKLIAVGKKLLGE